MVVVPHFKRLHELIANEKNFFAKEGLDVEFRDKVMDETANAPDFPRVSGETLASENVPSMNAACNWGVCVSAGALKGKLVNNIYFKTENSIFVRPDSKIRSPEQLANVEVGVGELSGSHFSGIQSLEKHIPKESIRIKFIGGPATRLRKLMSGEAQAVNLLPPAIYIARQLGYVEIVAGTYKTLLWAGNTTSRTDVNAYVRAMQEAQDELSKSPDSYKHYWNDLMPADFRALADVRKFGVGEILVSDPYSESEYLRTLNWMKTWGLTERMLEESYQKIVVE